MRSGWIKTKEMDGFDSSLRSKLDTTGEGRTMRSEEERGLSNGCLKVYLLREGLPKNASTEKGKQIHFPTVFLQRK